MSAQKQPAHKGTEALGRNVVDDDGPEDIDSSHSASKRGVGESQENADEVKTN
jgi:hypothetical protein